MAKAGRYCKAYMIQKFREFEWWEENVQNARGETQHIDGKEVKVPRKLSDSDFLYLQENFVVTDGIFIDENIIFDNITTEWKDYCKNKLKFEVPDNG
jgi:hypothetical protein